MLASVFDLALKYGYVRSAGKILRRAVYKDDWPLTRLVIMDFVHNVRRCMTLDPFGMRHEKVEEWREILLDSCAKLFHAQDAENDWFTPEDKLWIHETLSGRTHTHHRSLNPVNAARLFQKAVGVYQIEDLREFYEQDYHFLGKPYGVANPDTIVRFINGYEGSEMGPPVMVSVLCMREIVSLVGVGKDGLVHGEELVTPGLEAVISEFVMGSEFWFKTANRAFEDQIDDWPNILVELADAILRVGRRCDPDAKVTILSLEAMLAQLPWQHLILSRVQRSAGHAEEDAADRAAPYHVIAIVPNFSTITIAKPNWDMGERGIRTILSSEDDQAIATVSKVVQRTALEVDATGRPSICVILGHGMLQDDTGYPSVCLGAGATLASLADWISVLGFRHIVLHCCFGGRTEPLYMKELGGIPGIGLSLGADVFVAPVSEVDNLAAVALQEAIFAKTAPAELGLRYLCAIRANGEVSLYNIYGNPYEILLPRNDARNGEVVITTA